MKINEPWETAMTGWVKSTFCNLGDCVEVRTFDGGWVHLRDSKHPDRVPLVFTPGEWSAFVAGVRNGEFDLPAEEAL